MGHGLILRRLALRSQPFQCNLSIALLTTYYLQFPVAIHLRRADLPCITHPCATNVLLHPFDLHVLGTPPAFVLSQDQTLSSCFSSLLHDSLFFFFIFIVKFNTNPTQTWRLFWQPSPSCDFKNRRVPHSLASFFSCQITVSFPCGFLLRRSSSLGVFLATQFQKPCQLFSQTFFTFFSKFFLSLFFNTFFHPSKPPTPLQPQNTLQKNSRSGKWLSTLFRNLSFLSGFWSNFKEERVFYWDRGF